MQAGASLARLTAYYVERLAGHVATDGSGLDIAQVGFEATTRMMHSLSLTVIDGDRRGCCDCVQAPSGSVLAALVSGSMPPAQLNPARNTAVRTLIVLGHLARFGEYCRSVHVMHHAAAMFGH